METSREGRKRKMPFLVILFSVILTPVIALCIAAMISIAGNNKIVVESYTVETSESESTENNENVRIVLISDLHRKKFDETNQQLVDMAAAQKPDLICVDGDMLEKDCTRAEVEEFASLLERLLKSAPVYCSYGNHDYLSYLSPLPEDNTFDAQDANEYGISDANITIRERLERTGAVFLEQEYEDIIIKDRALRIGGMYGYAFKADNEYVWKGTERYNFLTKFCNTDSFKLLLCHRPDSFIFANAASNWDVDLVLSGHTHNGVIALPLMGALYAPDQGFFPKYAHGLFEIGRIKLVVCGGLDGYGKIPRVFNPPEIVTIDIN